VPDFLPPLLMAAARHGTMDTLEAADRQLQWIISMAMDQNHGTLVNIKIAGIYIYIRIYKWMFTPQSMVL
jgi:predicted negative regulator of RcsB-dependent stress response